MGSRRGKGQRRVEQALGERRKRAEELRGGERRRVKHAREGAGLRMALADVTGDGRDGQPMRAADWEARRGRRMKGRGIGREEEDERTVRGMSHLRRR